MKQLELYGHMQAPENVEETPAYQRWVYQREIELSRACGQAPEAEKIRFEDEHVTNQAANFELRCRKCRSVKPLVRVCMSPLDLPCRRRFLLSAYAIIGGHSRHLNFSSLTPLVRLATTRTSTVLL